VPIPVSFYLLALFVFGLAFGSFANVVIWRFPRGESLSHPASHCPSCGTPIRWHDNVPVVSWILLGRKCRACGVSISARYPTVELLGGLLWLAAGVQFGLSARLPAALFFYYLLLILAFIDLDTKRLPNKVVALLFVVGLLGALAAQFTGVPVVPLFTVGGGIWAAPLVSSALGAAVSAGVALLIALAYARVRRTQGFGMGDVKLLGAIGVFLGPYGLMTFFVGSALGAIYGLANARARNRSLRETFAFGPFLALGAVLVTLWGPTVWTWYVTLVTGG
jgi:leader peptidase (prepilin peptidase) / N-methyltransferase